MRAEISCAVYFLSSIAMFQSVPMWRLTEAMVRSMLLTAWRLAISPTRTSPDLENATTDGVVRPPAALAMTVGSPPSRPETTELLVPRSIPTARDMCCFLLSLETCWPRQSGGCPIAGAYPEFEPVEDEARPLIERSALNFTQSREDVNPELSRVRSTSDAGSSYGDRGGLTA